jgi:hypothetical protein
MDASVEVCHGLTGLTRERLVSQRPLLIKALSVGWAACGKWTRSWLVTQWPSARVRVYVAESRVGVLGSPCHLRLDELDETRARHPDVFVANVRARDIDPSLLEDIQRPFGTEIGGDEGNLWVGELSVATPCFPTSHCKGAFRRCGTCVPLALRCPSW